MSDAEQGRAEPAKGVASPGSRRGHVFDVLTVLRDRGPAEHEPDRVEVDRAAGVVEVEFGSGPAAVVAWAAAMRFPRPSNRDSVELMQTIVEAFGSVYGWRVELRHVHTAPSGLGRSGRGNRR